MSSLSYPVNRKLNTFAIQLELAFINDLKTELIYREHLGKLVEYLIHTWSSEFDSRWHCFFPLKPDPFGYTDPFNFFCLFFGNLLGYMFSIVQPCLPSVFSGAFMLAVNKFTESSKVSRG